MVIIELGLVGGINFFFIDPGVIAVANEELQVGRVRRVGTGIEDLADDTIVAGKPDIAGCVGGSS